MFRANIRGKKAHLSTPVPLASPIVQQNSFTLPFFHRPPNSFLTGNATLNNVFQGPTPEIPAGFTPDIYNVEPSLGFYCLYRPRPGENITADTITCPNISAVAKQHAEWLTDAGYDYVAIDITNWPVTGWIGSSTTVPNNDITILRPLEVLAEEWLALRAAGIKTPSIAAWTNVECTSRLDRIRVILALRTRALTRTLPNASPVHTLLYTHSTECQPDGSAAYELRGGGAYGTESVFRKHSCGGRTHFHYRMQPC